MRIICVPYFLCGLMDVAVGALRGMAEAVHGGLDQHIGDREQRPLHACRNAVGDTKRPLYYLLIAGVVNVVLNLVFVIVFHMGVAGVATATVASQAISAALVVRCLIST